MEREEALMFMGLDEDATEADIKAAYREMSQILHPDKFNNNERLRNRATEQFKRLGDARDTLLSGKGASGRGSWGGVYGRSKAGASGTQADTRNYSSREAQLNARLNGIAAARVTIVAYRDTELDSRRNGIIFCAVSLLCLLAGRKFPLILAVGSTGLIWGIVKIGSSISTIRVLNDKLDELEGEKKKCLAELEECE